MTKDKAISILKKAEPFIGTDKGFKYQHGKKWKQAKKKYFEILKEKHNKAVKRHYN